MVERASDSSAGLTPLLGGSCILTVGALTTLLVLSVKRRSETDNINNSLVGSIKSQRNTDNVESGDSARPER